jgi:hypothetical protein
MRFKLLCVTTLLLFGSASWATSLPLRVGYYGPYFDQYGLSIGTSFDRNFWLTGDDYIAHQHAWSLSPQIAYFVRSNTHQNWFVNVDYGRKSLLKSGNAYRKMGIGAGYQLSQRVLSRSVDLATGDQTKTSTNIHYFVPTLHFEYGRRTDRAFDWYGKAFYGRRISQGREDSAYFGLELGVQLKLKKDE